MKTIINRIKTIDIISIIIIVIGFLFLWLAEASEVINAHVTQLMVMVCAFYYAASSRSAAKDKIIQDMAKKE